MDRSRKARGARRRKRRMGRVEHDLSDEQWIALKAAWAGCAYCGATDKALQRDCVQALSRGGRYTLDNIAPSCGSCNASKCNEEVTGWLRRKRLDERAFLVRHYEINAALALRFPARPNAEAEAPEATTVPTDRPGYARPVMPLVVGAKERTSSAQAPRAPSHARPGHGLRSVAPGQEE